MTAVLALLASLVWGSSDFVGGTISRRYRPLVVVGIAHAIALVTLVVIALGVGSFGSGLGYLPWAIAAGVVGFVGLLAFYRALSTGTMGIVAPIAGTGSMVPVLVGLAGGDNPSTLQLVGIVVAVGGVVLASGPELSGSGVGGRRPLVLAVVAAISFGVVFVLIDRGSAHDVVMTLLTMRMTSVIVVSCIAAIYLTRRRRARADAGSADDRRVAARIAMPGWRDIAVIGFVGWTDAGANGLYGFATRNGLVSVVSVLASLYPAVTVVLARVIHDERMRRIQGIGVLCALCGVVLLAV